MENIIGIDHAKPGSERTIAQRKCPDCSNMIYKVIVPVHIKGKFAFLNSVAASTIKPLCWFFECHHCGWKSGYITPFFGATLCLAGEKDSTTEDTEDTENED